MLFVIAIVLLVLWLLGFVVFHVAGGLIHLVLVVAVIMFVVAFVVVAHRPTVAPDAPTDARPPVGLPG